MRAKHQSFSNNHQAYRTFVILASVDNLFIDRTELEDIEGHYFESIEDVRDTIPVRVLSLTHFMDIFNNTSGNEDKESFDVDKLWFGYVHIKDNVKKALHSEDKVTILEETTKENKMKLDQNSHDATIINNFNQVAEKYGTEIFDLMGDYMDDGDIQEFTDFIIYRELENGDTTNESLLSEKSNELPWYTIMGWDCFEGKSVCIHLKAKSSDEARELAYERVRLVSGCDCSDIPFGLAEPIKGTHGTETHPAPTEWVWKLPSNTIWFGYDASRVIANTYEEALMKAKATLRTHIDKMNSELKCDSININYDAIEVEKY